MQQSKITIFWFRRDLRLIDNKGLFKALCGKYPVLPIFIFDTHIIDELPVNDARISFIYEQLVLLNKQLKKHNSSLYCLKGSPQNIWSKLINEFAIQSVYFNEDYEPYAIRRDAEISQILNQKKISCISCKDQVILAKDQVLKPNHTPYTVYTPYKNKWLQKFEKQPFSNYGSEEKTNYYTCNFTLPSLKELNFKANTIKVLPFNLENLANYEELRNIPSLQKTSNIGPHLRFGTISIRYVVAKTKHNLSYLNELIWREFFMQILFHFPRVVHTNFKEKYNTIKWRNNPEEFEKWKNGQTGYPMVDAGMRELNATGYMHNRVRMVVASFLCKHLLIDWRWGEAYFAEKLLDYELASNNGNWQWAAGTGCDAAPYFRIFNPTEQVKKFDPQLRYVKKWIPELESLTYPTPMVPHKMARERAINTYKEGLLKTSF